MSKFKDYYAKTTGAISGVQTWEHIIMLVVFSVGIKGFLGDSIGYLAFGPYAPIYWLIMLLCPILYEIGQLMYPPNGLVVCIAAIMLISGVSFALYAGIAVALGTLVFTGYGTLVVFAVGGLLRVVQMFVQLDRLQRITVQFRKEQDATGDNYDSNTGG